MIFFFFLFYFFFLHQFQASAGHQTAGSQDSVSTGVGGHASAVGEFKSEPADVLSPASSAETKPGERFYIYGMMAALNFQLDVVDQGLSLGTQHPFRCSLGEKWES